MVNLVVSWIQARMVREDGQDLIEYALLGGLIALGIAAAVASGFFETAVEGMAAGIGECFDFDGTPCTP